MSWIFFAIICVAIAGGTYYMVRRKKQQQVVQHPLTYSVDIPDACYEDAGLFHTPGGVTVRSYCPVSDDALARIEAGIAHTIRNTRRLWPDWVPFSTLAEHQVFLVPPATHNVETDPGSPALLVKYLGQDGKILTTQAAGTCIGVPGGILGLEDPRYPSIVEPFEPSELPDHAPYLEESSRNEDEHIQMRANNLQMFFNYVGANDQHPIFPDEGFAAEPTRAHITVQRDLTENPLTTEQRASIRDIRPV